MNQRTFTCPRTCSLAQECRFSPLWAGMGPSRVYSHTVKVDIDLYCNPAALADAVGRFPSITSARFPAMALAPKFIGQGTHRMYDGQEHEGLAFHLPGWLHPIVAKADGTLAYDDYGGMWGNPADITRLQSLFALSAARTAAEAEGWMVEDTADGLIVHHPGGGYMTVDASGNVDASGFNGQGCHSATMTLADAIGRGEATAKPEYFTEQARLLA